MKTTKKNSKNKAVKNTKKTAVKKSIESKKISQPKQSEAVKTQNKTGVAKKVFKYETTFPRTTLKDKKEIVKLLKAEPKEVRERIAERKIKLTDIVKLSKYGHKQILNGELKSTSMKFYLTLKDEKKYCLNFGDYELINSSK